MQMFAPLQAPQIARGLSPQTATCRGSYTSAHQASWQVCEHSSCCTSSAPVSAYCATAPPVLHVMPASMGCVGHTQTSEICCRASGLSRSQAGKELRLSGTLSAGLSALIVDRKGTCLGAHHARIALCKLLHLVLQGLCGVYVIHSLHLRTRLSLRLRLRTRHCSFCPSCQQMTESASSTACRPQPCSLCHRLQRQLLTCQQVTWSAIGLQPACRGS